MQLVNSPEELKQILLNPNPAVVYGVIPGGHKADSKKAEQILSNMTNIVVYGDIKICNRGITFLKFNPSFDVNIIMRRFALDSPLFIRANHSIYINSNNINEIALEIMSQIPGVHIPEIISTWNQS